MSLVRVVLAGVLGACLAGTALAQPKSEPFPRAEMEAGLVELPVFRSMRDHHPEVFRKVLDATREGLLAGDTRDDVAARVRPLYLALIDSEMPKANDENLLGAVRMTLSQMRMLQTVSPDACYGLIVGDKTVSFASALTPELIAEEQAWATQMFEQTATAPVTRPTEDLSDQIAELALSAYETLSRPDRARFMELGGDLSAASSPDDRRIGCAFGVAMYELLLEMPKAEAARLFYAMIVEPEA
ncbi:hypothetical protein ACFODL_01150 [Phenylobacterium terrae]|uniref:Uncharacterized protein n=1 Tax=Phenylobacterium terrae TaxID=2665495 RepID=A0ABW4MWM8_9CAUL